MIAIGPDDPGQATELAARLGLTFPVVSDGGLALTRQFGIVFQAPERDPLPVPAVYLVDRTGTIVFQFVHPDYRLRLNPELLLAATKTAPARKPEKR
jgi:peroxiredoxin